MRKAIVTILFSLFILTGCTAPQKTIDYVWNESTAPNYYEVVGKAELTEDIKTEGVCYSSLDEYGRAKKSYILITNDSIDKAKARGRQEFDSSVKKLAGWGHNKKVDIKLDNGKVYHGYFFNRSHLVADSLGGNPSVSNIVTGTRMQNVGDNDKTPGGMAYAETKVRNWFKHNTGYIQYEVEPIYNGNDKLPIVCIINMKSSDNSIDEKVIVYNAAKGYEVNYSDGTFSKR